MSRRGSAKKSHKTHRRRAEPDDEPAEAAAPVPAADGGLRGAAGPSKADLPLRDTGDNKTRSVFSIVGSCFVDTFFNHTWESSRAARTGEDSLTDEFKRQVHAFMMGVRTDKECYGTAIQSVQKYFAAVTKYTSITYAEFIDMIIGQCIPAEYFKELTSNDKDELLNSVVCDLVANLAAFVTTPDMLVRVIDNHSTTPEVTIQMLQDRALHILMTKRSELHNQFMRRAGHARPAGSAVEQTEALKAVIRRLVYAKNEAIARAEGAEDALEAARSQLAAAKVTDVKLRKLVDMYRARERDGPIEASFAARIPPRDRIAEAHASHGPARTRPRAMSNASEAGDGGDAPALPTDFFAAVGSPTTATRASAKATKPRARSRKAEPESKRDSREPSPRREPEAKTPEKRPEAVSKPVESSALASLLNNTIDDNDDSELNEMLGLN